VTKLSYKQGALSLHRLVMSNLSEELGHLKNHVQYPASRNEVVAACNNMSDVPSADKEWVAKTLPEGRYTKADDVMTALLTKV